jgi:DNA replication protein DnaC
MDESPPQCPRCYGSGMEVVTGKGARLCECRRAEIRSQLLAAIPERFTRDGVPMLDSLRPRFDLNVDPAWATAIGKFQHGVIAQMRQTPAASFTLCGKIDSGKTHLAYALYTEAVNAGRPVVAMSLSQLFDELQRMTMRDSGATGQEFVARIYPQKLVETQKRWFLLIDEIDKPKWSEP